MLIPPSAAEYLLIWQKINAKSNNVERRKCFFVPGITIYGHAHIPPFDTCCCLPCPSLLHSPPRNRGNQGQNSTLGVFFMGDSVTLARAAYSHQPSQNCTKATLSSQGKERLKAHLLGWTPRSSNKPGEEEWEPGQGELLVLKIINARVKGLIKETNEKFKFGFKFRKFNLVCMEGRMQASCLWPPSFQPERFVWDIVLSIGNSKGKERKRFFTEYK